MQGKAFREYLSDIGLYGVVQFLTPFTALITLSLLTKFLGVKEYGTFALAITTAGLLIWLVLLNLPSALVRFLPGEKDKKVISGGFTTSLLIILLAGVVIFLSVVLLADLLAVKIFHDSGAKVYLYIIALRLIFDACRVTLMTYFRVWEQVKRYLKYEILYNLVNLAFLAVAVFLWRNLLVVFVAFLLSSVVLTVWLLAIFIRQQGLHKPSWAMAKFYLWFCLPLIVPNVMSRVITFADRYFISYFWGVKAVGIYDATYNLPSVITTINGAIWFVFLPVVARLWNTGAYEEVRSYFSRAVKLFAMVGIPATFGLIFLGNPIMTLLSTAEIGQESWKVVPFICLSNIGYVIYGYGADLFILQRKPERLAYFMTTAAGVSLLGNFLLIPRYGILGAAIANLIAYVVLAGISLGSARRFFTFPVDGIFIAKTIFASGVMSVFLWFFGSGGLWGVVLSILLGALVYFIVLFLMKGFNKAEIEFVKSFFRLKRRQAQN